MSAPTLISGHRSDIEGLRAVAVAAVLLYHSEVPGVQGGYVGVDVFFVVSGYLMTALLVSERWQSGRIAYRSFYARRARRLLPASVTVLLATLLAAWIVLPPLSFERSATDITAAGGYVVNVRFAIEATDYLGSDIGASPVLHYWSLAVEEQFYLVWPLVLGLVLSRTGRRHGPIVMLSVISVVSFWLAVVWTAAIQPWAFFSLPARAWEFAIGGLAAFVIPSRNQRWWPVVGWFGLAIVLGSIAVLDEATRFPGPSAAVPVIGTALVLISGGRSSGPGLLLAAAPLQWIGRHSYGIYLWHWPPLVLVPVAVGRELKLIENLGLVAAAVGVAAIALRFIENPIRFSPRFAATPWRSALLGLGLTAAALCAPWWARSTIDTPETDIVASIEDVIDNAPNDTDGQVSDDPVEPEPRFVIDDPSGPSPVPANLVPPLTDVGDDRAGDLYKVGCHRDQRAVEPLLPCAYGDLDAPITVVLFGDSHMAQWFPAFEPMGVEANLRVVSLTKSACPSATITINNIRFDRQYDECDQWRDATIAAIVNLQPDVVVLGNYPGSSTGLPGDTTEGFNERWVEALATTIQRLAPSGAEILVMGPTPIPPGDIPDCVSGALEDSSACDLERDQAVKKDRIEAERIGVATAAMYLDVTDWFCGPNVCPVVLGEYLVYRDGSHIATPYMAWLTPILAQAWLDLGFPTAPAPP